MANVIITTHWGEGDVLPFISIGKELKKVGHNVTIFTHYCHGKKVKSENIEFISVDSLKECESFFHELTNMSNDVSNLSEINKFRKKYENKEKILKEYNLLKDYCKKENTLIIAKNRSSLAALLLAEKFNLPLISVYMNPYEYGSINSYHNLNKKELLQEINELRNSIGLTSIDSWINWQLSPKMKVGLWPNWYKNRFIDSGDNIKTIGFPLRDLDFNNVEIKGVLKKILDGNPAPIIISGGTTDKIKNIFYEKAIEACSNLDREVIVITKYKDRIPKKLPENTHYFDYIPLYKALLNTSLIIHHGGIGTTSNAIKRGIPQLILADCNDTPMNGSIVKSLKIGEYLPPIKWNVKELQEKINILLSNEFKSKCEQFAEKQKEENAFDSMIKLVNEVENYRKYVLDYEVLINNEKFKVKKDEEKINQKRLSEKMQKYLLKKIKNK